MDILDDSDGFGAAAITDPWLLDLTAQALDAAVTLLIDIDNLAVPDGKALRAALAWRRVMAQLVKDFAPNPPPLA